MRMIENFKEELKNSLKEVQEKMKKLGKINKSLKGNQEKRNIKQVKQTTQTVQDLKTEIEAIKKTKIKGILDMYLIRSP